MDFFKGNSKGGKDSSKTAAKVKAGVVLYLPSGDDWECLRCANAMPLINDKVKDVIFLGATPSQDKFFREACAHAVCKQCWNRKFSTTTNRNHNPYDYFGTPSPIMHPSKKSEQVAVLETLSDVNVNCMFHQNPVNFILYFYDFSSIDALERIALKTFAEKGYEIASYRIENRKIQDEFGHIRNSVIKKKFIEVFCKRAKSEELNEHLAALNF